MAASPRRRRTATLRLDGLDAAGAGLRALAVQAGRRMPARRRLEATAEGLRLPGPVPDLLAGAPLRLTAGAALDAPGRPVRFSLAHPLAGLEGTARTAGALSAEATNDAARSGPAGGGRGRGCAGRAATDGQGELARRRHPGGLLTARLGVTGVLAPLPALLGPDATLGLSAALRRRRMSRCHRLRIDGRAVTA